MVVSGLQVVGVPENSGTRVGKPAGGPSAPGPGSRPAAGQHGLSPWAGGRGSPRDNDKPPQSLISRKKTLFFLLVGTNGQTFF